MMGKTISGLLVVVAIIHLLPVGGVLGAERLAVLYGVPIQDPNLLILMRHRAVLFGLLGLFLLYAAFRPQLQLIALVAGMLSTVSFLWLALEGGHYNAAIGRVVVADVIAVACVAIATGLHVLQQRQG